jgi:hypothetical protein
MVEGAEHYELQVDTNTQFNSLLVNVSTAQNSFTPTSTLANGTYYWRVRVARYNSVFNAWSAPQTFTLNLPQPTGLSPNGATVNRAPTFCWTPISQSVNGNPVLTAWKYRFQSSRTDPTFSNPYETIDTEQACWTPQMGYDDGNYFWRVAMFDGNNRMGNFSPAAQFTKQYPITTLVSPANGSMVAGTPTFVWTPVNGAASYRLQVSAVDTFAPLDEDVTTNNIRFMPPRVYNYTATYYWRVAIIDQYGRPGPYNTATIIPLSGAYKLYLPLILR